VAVEDVKRLLDRASKRDLVKLDNKIESLRVNSPAAPPRGMVLNDAPTPVDPVIYIRGNPGRPGKQVSRHFLQAVGTLGGTRFKKGSGRLELAENIASPQNPLTARVIVNRVWMHHFGAGIVRTASDFGVRGTPPSHPELLDYLADRFVSSHWSVKAMHRLIMLSSTYRQSTELNPISLASDPENRLLWRMNRRRPARPLAGRPGKSRRRHAAAQPVPDVGAHGGKNGGLRPVVRRAQLQRRDRTAERVNSRTTGVIPDE
jgi:hypothetical protein